MLINLYLCSQLFHVSEKVSNTIYWEIFGPFLWSLKQHFFFLNGEVMFLPYNLWLLLFRNLWVINVLIKSTGYKSKHSIFIFWFIVNMIYRYISFKYQLLKRTHYRTNYFLEQQLTHVQINNSFEVAWFPCYIVYSGNSQFLKKY